MGFAACSTTFFFNFREKHARETIRESLGWVKKSMKSENREILYGDQETY